MVWWTKKSAFAKLKLIDSTIHSSLKKLEKIEGLFNKKVELAKKVKEAKGNPRIITQLKKIRLSVRGIYKAFHVEESELMQLSNEESNVLNDLDKLIIEEKKKPISQRQLFFLKDPYKVEILRILMQLLELFRKEKIYLDKAIKNPTMITKFFYEFEGYIKEEATLIGKEKNVLFLLESELKKEEITEEKLDFYFVGYGSLMNSTEIMGELKTTLQKASSSDVHKDWELEFKKRVIAVNVHGYKRVFDKVATRGRWETEDDVNNKKIGVLNIKRKTGSYFNAVAIRTTKEEFDSIIAREKNYGQEILKNVTDFKSGEKIEGKCVAVIAEMFKADKVKQFKNKKEYLANAIKVYSYGQNPDNLIRPNILPIPHYLNTISEGVKNLDRLLGTKNMEEIYFETTFLNYFDKTLKRDFGVISLKDYLKVLEVKRSVIKKKSKKAMSMHDVVALRAIYKEITGKQNLV